MISQNIRTAFSVAALFITAVLVCGPGFSQNQLVFPNENKVLVGAFTRQVNDREMFEYDDMTGDKVDLNYKYFLVSYGVFKNMAVDFRLGSADYDIIADYGSSLAWGVGLRTALFDFEDTSMTLGAGFQYDKYDPDSAPHDGLAFSSDGDEWSLSLDLTKRFGIFAVAAGIEYSELTLPFTHPERGATRTGGFEQDNHIGLYLGGDVMVYENFGLATEVHLIADESYKLGLFYKF